MLCAVGEEKVLLNCCVCNIWPMCVLVLGCPHPSCELLYMNTHTSSPTDPFQVDMEQKRKGKSVIISFQSPLTFVCHVLREGENRARVKCVFFSLKSQIYSFNFKRRMNSWWDHLKDDFLMTRFNNECLNKWTGLGVRRIIFNFGNVFPCHLYCILNIDYFHSLICFR